VKVQQQGAVEIHAETDIVVARQAIRQAATEIGFGVLDTTRIVTAASELARNIFKYAGKGVMSWQILDHDQRGGLEVAFKDEGPGIANVNDALREGFSTGGGLGMGLPGAKRLMDEMEVRSVPGQGTTVIVRKWLQGLNP
jgi:serine/threonine-protein kinase RsbT